MNTPRFFSKPLCVIEVRFTLVHTVLFILFVGCIVTVMGLVLDCNREVEAMAQGGLSAVVDYRRALQASPVDSSFQCLMLALQGRMPSVGSNLQVLGLACCYLLVPLLMFSAMLKRIVTKYVRLPVAREVEQA